MVVIYHQQAPPSLTFASLLAKLNSANLNQEFKILKTLQQLLKSHYKISTLLPLDAICITTNCVVTGVCFATFVQKRGNRGTVLPQK
jgi:hypothetical protein